MGGTRSKIEVKEYCEATLQRKKEEVKKEFFRGGKTREEWKAVSDSAFVLWGQMKNESDRELLEAICTDSWVEWQKLVPERERLKKSIKAEIMRGKVRD